MDFLIGLLCFTKQSLVTSRNASFEYAPHAKSSILLLLSACHSFADKKTYYWERSPDLEHGIFIFNDGSNEDDSSPHYKFGIGVFEGDSGQYYRLLYSRYLSSDVDVYPASEVTLGELRLKRVFLEEIYVNEFTLGGLELRKPEGFNAIWSPDGKYVAVYESMRWRGYISIYSVEDEKVSQVRFPDFERLAKENLPKLKPHIDENKPTILGINPRVWLLNHVLLLVAEGRYYEDKELRNFRYLLKVKIEKNKNGAPIARILSVEQDYSVPDSTK